MKRYYYVGTVANDPEEALATLQAFLTLRAVIVREPELADVMASEILAQELIDEFVNEKVVILRTNSITGEIDPYSTEFGRQMLRAKLS